MEEFRSSYRSNGGGGRTLEIINGKAYSVNGFYVTQQPRYTNPLTPLPLHHHHVSRKSISSSSVKSWWNNPEMKRKKRIAKYKMYAVEGKVKASLKKGFRWFKHKCTNIVRGF